jgi:hypothetical protein
MYDALTARVRDNVGAVKRQLSTSETLRALIADGKIKCAATPTCFDLAALAANPPDATQWRIIDHCSAVTRLYAILEQFAHEIVGEYLTFLEHNYKYSELTKKFHDAYRMGVAKILDKKEGPRYADLSLTDLASNFANAVGGVENYRLERRAMLIQEQNLRMTELARIFANIGIPKLEEWLKSHPGLIAFFAAEDRENSTADGELATLVSYRNDAAHGGFAVDDLVGLATLNELADFVVALCEALADRVQRSVIEGSLSVGRATRGGVVSESLKGDLVAIGHFSGTFEVGQVVYLLGKAYCLERRVDGIQLNNISHERFVAANAELGLRLDHPGRKKAVLIIVGPDLRPDPVQSSTSGNVQDRDGTKELGLARVILAPVPEAKSLDERLEDRGATPMVQHLAETTRRSPTSILRLWKRFRNRFFKN